jgi:hypothetical protein
MSYYNSPPSPIPVAQISYKESLYFYSTINSQKLTISKLKKEIESMRIMYKAQISGLDSRLKHQYNSYQSCILKMAECIPIREEYDQRVVQLLIKLKLHHCIGAMLKAEIDYDLLKKLNDTQFKQLNLEESSYIIIQNHFQLEEEEVGRSASVNEEAII